MRRTFARRWLFPTSSRCRVRSHGEAPRTLHTRETAYSLAAPRGPLDAAGVAGYPPRHAVQGRDSNRPPIQTRSRPSLLFPSLFMRTMLPRIGGALESPYHIELRLPALFSSSHIIGHNQTLDCRLDLACQPLYYCKTSVPYHPSATSSSFLKNLPFQRSSLLHQQ